MEGAAAAHPLMATAWPLLSSALAWLLGSLLVGAIANRLPPAWLERGQAGPRWDSAAFYAGRLAIRRWKRWLPDAGSALPCAACCWRPSGPNGSIACCGRSGCSRPCGCRRLGCC